MLILIAESKTMGACDGLVSQVEYETHRPMLEDDVDRLMASLRDMSADELSRAVKISPAMARRLLQMIYEFPDKRTGGRAIESFTGVVFKAFDYRSLDADIQRRACVCVRIVSSLYGWLRPDDVVKPYRFDFTTALAPDGKTFAAYWKDSVTDCLLRELSAGGHTDVLNLLPGDAARCIDWTRVSQVAGVWRAEFREVRSGGGERTPNAGKLKRLRGQLLRQMMCEDVTRPEELMSLSGKDYMGSGVSDEDGNIVFHCVE